MAEVHVNSPLTNPYHRLSVLLLEWPFRIQYCAWANISISPPKLQLSGGIGVDLTFGYTIGNCGSEAIILYDLLYTFMYEPLKTNGHRNTNNVCIDSAEFG